MGASLPFAELTKHADMKCMIVLAALVALAYSQQGHRPGFNHGDPLHHMIHDEVKMILDNNSGMGAKDCTSKCDALFDMQAEHDEPMTDRLCQEECSHALNPHATHPPRPSHQPRPTPPPRQN